MSRSGMPLSVVPVGSFPRPGCSQLPGRPFRAARPLLRPAWSALSSGSCRAPLRDVEGSTVSAPAVRWYGAGCPLRTDAMPQDETSGGFSANSGAPDGCDAALRDVRTREMWRASGTLRVPSRPRGPASAARSRMSSVLSGRTTGTTRPPRAIALITPPRLSPSRGARHEPYVYKTWGGTLTFCTVRFRRHSVVRRPLPGRPPSVSRRPPFAVAPGVRLRRPAQAARRSASSTASASVSTTGTPTASRLALLCEPPV